MTSQIKEIVTHLRPHADELVALMFLRNWKEGEDKFPGVKNAKISFLTSGELPDGKTANDFPEKIFLGVGGGIFDEHATSQKERVENETCATLVAKELGISNDPALEKILYFIKEEDLHGSKVRNELPMIIKFLHQCYGNDAESIYSWAEKAYLGLYKEYGEQNDERLRNKNIDQRPTLENVYSILKKQNPLEADNWKKFADDAMKFREKRFSDAKVEFSEKGKIETITAWDGKPLKVATIMSDNEEMNKFVRSIGAHLVVQFNSRGNVAIMTDTKRGIDLSRAFVLLRMAEQHYRGGIKIKDEETLSKEGFVEGIPYWYLFHTKGMGFNGSSTTTDIEPTKIPHDKVEELIKEALK